MKEQIRSELEQIREKAGGILFPHDVIAFAEKHPNSALYSEFEWDDSEAAQAYRMHQARSIIRAVVIPMNSPDGQALEVRAYLALPSDRRGYRSMIEIVSDRQLATEALNRCLMEIERMRQKYSSIAVLAGMLDELTRKIQEEQEAQKQAKARRKKSAG